MQIVNKGKCVLDAISHFVGSIFPSCLKSSDFVMPPWLALLRLSRLMVHLIICYLIHILCQSCAELSCCCCCFFQKRFHVHDSSGVFYKTLTLKKWFVVEERVRSSNKFEITWPQSDSWFQTKQTNKNSCQRVLVTVGELGEPGIRTY